MTQIHSVQLPITKAQILAYRRNNLTADIAWAITTFIASLSANNGGEMRSRIYQVITTIGTLCCILFLNNVQKQAHIEGILDDDVFITDQITVGVPAHKQYNVSFYRAIDKYMAGVIVPYIHPKITFMLNNFSTVAVIAGIVGIVLILLGKLFTTIMFTVLIVMLFIAWKVATMSLPPA